MAKVYYSIMSDLARQSKSDRPWKSNGTIKRELRLSRNYTKIQDLTLVKDESIEYGNKIDEMLQFEQRLERVVFHAQIERQSLLRNFP